MKIVHLEPSNHRQVHQFLELPFHVYQDIPQWVPPLATDIARMLDNRQHPFYKHSQAAFFLALDSRGEAIGRLAVLDNRNYNHFNQTRSAFFYLFECQDDRQAADQLFSAGFDWARARGLEVMVGPKGFTALDGLGLLVKGCEHRPAFGIPYNPPYYGDLVETCGFTQSGELVSGYLSRQNFRMPEKILEVARLVQERRGLKVMRFEKRSDLRKLVPSLRELYNASLGGTSGNVPLTEDEVQTLADQMLWFADPKLIKIIIKDGQPVGFLFAYPDISAAIQRSHGRLLPFGWADMLLELRRTKWLNINGAGIIEKYRGMGGTALLFSELYKTVSGSRFEHTDVVQIGIENDRMLRELRDLGVDFYKTHRLFQREL